MTKHTGFRRACSLRVPKAPGLLDRVPGSSYGSLEEAPLPWEAEEAPWRADGSLGQSQERASQEAARKKGSCRHQALSLKGQDMKDEEASPAGEASDGHLLIGQAHGKAQASNRVKRCQKKQEGFQLFPVIPGTDHFERGSPSFHLSFVASLCTAGQSYPPEGLAELPRQHAQTDADAFGLPAHPQTMTVLFLEAAPLEGAEQTPESHGTVSWTGHPPTAPARMENHFSQGEGFPIRVENSCCPPSPMGTAPGLLLSPDGLEEHPEGKEIQDPRVPSDSWILVLTCG
ncbi:uncharacterized protein LOC131186874 [Ahaetulla prasina]|uniref:uncharacterized protein LOC131186874 n=1 Tax=Ahaetulla prasina TaxID=499056 RepID=UPI00264722B1|nr:uncharacterized protein LOC131186874 [Ahaetulla prasina]